MKKSLYMTTALVAAGVLAFGATDASAQKAKKMSVGVSGFMKSVVVFAQQDSAFESTANSTARTHYDTFNMINDSEVIFKGTTKLDNGIAVSVQVQMEADAVNSGSIDESYVKLTGGFGDIRMGSTKAASFVLKHAAPGGVGAFTAGSGDAFNLIVRPAAIAATIAKPNTHVGPGDAMKLVYISPKFNGFRFGASITPSNTNSDIAPQVGGNAGTQTQTYDAIVSYENKMNGMNLKADAAVWETHGNAASSVKALRGGLHVGFGGITVGGSYQKKKDMDTGVTANAATIYDFGIQYASGPYKVGLQYLNASSAQGTAPGDDEQNQFALGASYAMGPGVSLLGTIMRVDYNDETTADANNNDGWGAIGGIKVSF